MGAHTDHVRHGCCCDTPDLTRREIGMLALVAAGWSNTEIASDLSLSPDTVAHHLHDMLGRAQARNRVELVARSYVSGLLDPETWPPTSTGRRCIVPLVPLSYPASIPSGSQGGGPAQCR
ncbi:MAG: LuxR C-terminal-related transcriptional regulator [Streptosporangiales bacterium]